MINNRCQCGEPSLVRLNGKCWACYWIANMVSGKLFAKFAATADGKALIETVTRTEIATEEDNK